MLFCMSRSAAGPLQKASVSGRPSATYTAVQRYRLPVEMYDSPDMRLMSAEFPDGASRQHRMCPEPQPWRDITAVRAHLTCAGSTLFRKHVPVGNIGKRLERPPNLYARERPHYRERTFRRYEAFLDFSISGIPRLLNIVDSGLVQPVLLQDIEHAASSSDG